MTDKRPRYPGFPTGRQRKALFQRRRDLPGQRHVGRHRSGQIPRVLRIETERADDAAAIVNRPLRPISRRELCSGERYAGLRRPALTPSIL
jgi:hypothetical protein